MRVRPTLVANLFWKLAAVALVIIICLVLSMAVLFRHPPRWAAAQSPTPTVKFANVLPGVTTAPGHGIVVEGLVDGCEGKPTAIDTAEATVDWLEKGYQVWTEMSIVAFCGKTMTEYEEDFVLIMNYVLNNTTPQYLGRWHGFMFDEESAFEFNVSELVDFHGYVFQVLDAFTVPPTWVATESFSGQGDWSQADFNSITYATHPAPQIATDYMVGLTNSFYQSFGTPVLVTWSEEYENEEYNSEAESVDAVNGTPYNLTINGKVYYYSNQFCAGSCM